LIIRIMGISPLLICYNQFLNPFLSKKMYRNLTGTGLFEQTESQHKDVVISSLKKELFELKDLEHDFLRLNDEVASIESKYSLLLDEKERAENEHKLISTYSESRSTSTRRLLGTYAHRSITSRSRSTRSTFKLRTL
jgi:hypothetical protein